MPGLAPYPVSIPQITVSIVPTTHVRSAARASRCKCDGSRASELRAPLPSPTPEKIHRGPDVQVVARTRQFPGSAAVGIAVFRVDYLSRWEVAEQVTIIEPANEHRGLDKTR
jgi:hypothetical protein